VNSLYIGIGVAIIVALMTALIGPYFVDWTAYRSVFEREGQKIFGENVTVLGQAQVRLLPAPSISLDDVVIGPVDRPDLKIDRLDLKIEMTPLLKGEIRISDLRLDRPVMRLGLDAEGRPVLPGLYALQRDGGGTEVGAIGLEFAEIVDGRMLLFDERSGVTTTINAVNGTASAAALSGPLKLDGGANIDGHPFSFHFATGLRGADGGWSMRLQANPVEAPFQLDLDATLDTGAAVPKATGMLSLQRLAVGDTKGDKFNPPPAPWQLQTHFSGDQTALAFDDMQLSVGDAETAFTMTGKGSVAIGAVPKFDMALAAKQIDLDRLIARKIDEPTDPAAALDRLQAVLLGLPRLPFAGRLRLAVGGVVIGGGAVQEVDLDVRSRADGWAIDTMSARLPGRSQVTAHGRLTIDDAAAVATPATDPARQSGPRFEGAVSLSSDQPGALLQWWNKGAMQAIDPFSVTGQVAVARGSIRIDELMAKIGTANTRGAVQWQAATATRGTRLKATVSADQLDLDQAKLVANLVSANLVGANLVGLGPAEPVPRPAGDPSPGQAAVAPDVAKLPEFDVDLDAGTVLLAGKPLKGVAAKFAFDGASLTIDRLTVRDAIGAAIDVKGKIDRLTTTPDGAIDGSIRADKLTGLAHLVETLFPGEAWVKRLVAAAPALGPFNAQARLSGAAGADTSAMHVTLDGQAARSRLQLEATFGGRLDRLRQGALDASLTLEGPDGGLVLRQIGVPALSDSVSAGKLAVSLKGTPATGLSMVASADVAGTRLASSGHMRFEDDAAVSYDAELQATAKDLTLLATMIGQPLPAGGTSIPLDLRARVEGRGLKARISGLAGHLAEAGLTGGGEVDVSQTPVRIDAALQWTRMDLVTLLEFGLGADTFQMSSPKGTVWPSDVLSGPVFGALNAGIDLKADQLSLDAAHGIDRFAAKLRLRPGQMLLDQVGGRFAGGTLTGALGMTMPAGGEMGLTGNLQIKAARLADIVWRRDDRAVADGAMDLAVTFDSSGRSIAALAAGLNGNGALTISDGMMRYIDPEAFRAIIVAADGGLELKDDKIRSVFQSRLDAGTLPFDRIEAAFAIGGGVLRAKTVTVTSPQAQTTGSVALDVGRWTMDADWTLKVDPGKNGVVGAEPQVGVLFRGSIDQPKRSLDVSPLSAFLTLRAFEREVQRVEDMQQDIVEQQRFQRELKRLRDDRARREQEQKAAEIAARQRAIDARKAEEQRRAEDARKAAEARKADDAAKAAAIVDPSSGDGHAAAVPAPNAVPTATSVPSADPSIPATPPVAPAASLDQGPAETDGPKRPEPQAPVGGLGSQSQVPPSPSASQLQPEAMAPPAAGMTADPATVTAAPLSDRTKTQTVNTQSMKLQMAPKATDLPAPAQRMTLPDLPSVIFISPSPPVAPLAAPGPQ